MRVAQVVFRSSLTNDQHSIYNATLSKIDNIGFIKISGIYFEKKQISSASFKGHRKVPQITYIHSIDLKEYIGSEYYIKTEQVQYTGLQKFIRGIFARFNPAIKMDYTVHYFTQYVWKPVEVSTIITESMIVRIDAGDQIIDLNDVYREVYTFKTDDAGQVIGSLPLYDDYCNYTFKSI